MSVVCIYSDQLLNWSGNNEKQILHRPASTAKKHTGKASSSGCGAAGFFDHAVSTLRQTKLPLSPGGTPRTRAQVLPVGQSNRTTSGNGLHPTRLSGTGQRIFEQLSDDSRNTQRGLRHQPRTHPPPRAALGSANGPHLSDASCRYGATRHLICQYAAGLSVGGFTQTLGCEGRG